MSACTLSLARSMASGWPEICARLVEPSTHIRAPLSLCTEWRRVPCWRRSLLATPDGKGMVKTPSESIDGSSPSAAATSAASSVDLGVSAASITRCRAVSRCSGVPAMRTRQQAEGIVLSTSMRAPLAAWSSMSLAPRTPSTAPLTWLGSSKYSDSWSAASIAKVRMMFCAAATCASSPPITTLHGSQSLSTSTLAPVVVWISWT
mmetsp:Transcript_20044/g.54624  ORF Transcript_20044/g.54624 Transcript_20044/m.54624 type:complete len:205 (+) Transcript_20044:523-1137(+)